MEIINEANRAFVVQSGPIQPVINFKQSAIGKKLFKFQKKWYEEYKWLEYSVSKMLHFASIADTLEHLVCKTANNYLLS